MKKSANFRFYAELNDFLKLANRKKDLIYYFDGQPSIKDAIESMGVPHTEVDLILVNSKSVDFSYLLQEHDQISVYPVFESLDISPVIRCRPTPLRKPQFILDVHLGTLARYLRLLGIDTYYNNQYDDIEIIHLALEQKRIILTRDLNLLKNKIVTHGYWLRSTDPKQQVHEVLKRFDLKDQLQPFTRCIVCNGFIHPVAKEQVINQLPPKTKIYFHEFSQCEHCQKIYWRGAHFKKMLILLNEIQR